MHCRHWVAIICVISISATSPAAFAAYKSSPDRLRIVRRVLSAPDGETDFARAKLSLDKLVDPHVDVDATLRKIDAMVPAVKALAGSSPSGIQKLRAVRRYIYESGAWNGYRPFGYDLSDPLGKKISHKLLPDYLSTRLGNCVSMPVLFLILADRMGVHVTLSTAPDHIFARYVDDAGRGTMDLETTSGGYPARDVWIRQSFPMTDEAVANGVYLKTLSKRESLAVMAAVVLENDLARKRYREAIKVAEAILEAYPNFAPAMVDEGSAAAAMIDTEFRAKYPTPRDIPVDRRGDYLALVELNRAAFAKAEALGWREPGESSVPPPR